MGTERGSKIQKLLDRHRPDTVLLGSWLERQGVSRDLQKRYRQSGWLRSLGPGAFPRPADQVGWPGGLYALQTQAELPMHVGALTALEMHGLAHYHRLAAAVPVWLFSPPRTLLPSWFKHHDWGTVVRHVRTGFLPATLGLLEQEEKTFTLQVSSPERAMLECLYLAPDELDLVECDQLMGGLVNLRPQLVQELLLACTSVKVKRLFLYLAERAEHAWQSRVDPSGVELGQGTRSLAKGGAYVAKYRLVVPQSLAPQ